MEELPTPAFEWEQLPEQWQTKLLSKNFRIKNCLGDGNCQFRAIETAVKSESELKCKLTHDKLRKLIGGYLETLQNEEFWDIVKSYKLEKKHGEFIGLWDPHRIQYKRQFISIVKKPGNVFQGDHFTLSVLSKLLDIDFILFTSNLIQDLSNPDDLHSRIVILYYDGDQGHYQTIGLKSETEDVQTLFKRSELQDEIYMLIDRQTFLDNHTENVCKNDDLKLNDIIFSLEQNIQQKLSKSDKKKIMHLINNKLFK